jgi:hypothetical protein
LQNNVIDNEIIESEIMENEVLTKKSTTSQSLKQKMTGFQKSVVEILSKRKMVNDDEDNKLFLLSLLPTLKKMSSDKKFDLKIQIIQMLKTSNF